MKNILFYILINIFILKFVVFNLRNIRMCVAKIIIEKLDNIFILYN